MILSSLIAMISQNYSCQLRYLSGSYIGCPDIEKWFQLPLPGYVQCVGFYAFLIHSSAHSEVVFCTTSAYLSPCTRVYVRGISPRGRIFQIPTVCSNMNTQIPKWYLLISFGYKLVAIPRGNASIICGASYHVWDLGFAFCHHMWWCGERSEWQSVTAYISEELY